eukprot:GSChrysophyteH1.ASY1.ANO1.1407.1 assembled CDS
MHIQEVIIDGFKSYAQRTVVSGFDPQFNAITGLNGSGQAGVTKATVTIVFNNSNTAESPVGYESDKQITVTRQVVIGGKNKYMINGRTVQQSQVANLFHSVQLNVNNPHFLIMQGRITKVLNMKPEETLSMIEEAAGTRMFETKKQAALKTIEKKQLKVKELTQCLDEEITPTLDSLRSERQAYITWQSNNIELERLERFCTAAEYHRVETTIEKAEEERVSMNEKISSLQETSAEKAKRSKECGKLVVELEMEHEKVTEGELRILKNAETEAGKAVVKASAAMNNHQENMDSEVSSQKSTQLSAAEQALQNAEKECAAAETAAEEASTKYQNAIAGVADENSAALLSLPEQVGTWERRAREAESQQKQGELQLKHKLASLKELQKLAKTQMASQEGAIKEHSKLKAAVQDIQAKLSTFGNASTNEDSLKSELSAVKREASAKLDSVESLSAQLEARLAFEFKDPEKGFDRTRVKGLVARLVKVKDDRAATALEIAAGAKLTQVVVDSEKTGKLLLTKGQLKKRVTILPLNKINARCTDPAKVETAKKIAKKAGGTAHLALELVGYESEVSRAIQYVFGNTIICDTSDVAKAVAFHPDVKNRTVTLEGDDFNPAGTLTGGSNSNLGVILNKLNQLSQLASNSDKIEKLSSELDLKQHALLMCEEKMAESSYAQTQSEIKELEKDISLYDDEKKSLIQAAKKANDELKRLRTAQADMKKEREGAMKAIESEMKSAKNAVSVLQAALDEASSAVQEQQRILAASVKEIKALQVEQEETSKASESAQLEAREMAHQLKSFASFGKEGGDFDFQASDVGSSKKRLHEIKTQQEQISKKVNKKVMGMIEKAESEYANLNKKRDVILKDKASIEDVIEELNLKKMQALNATWVKVNRDFGSIFSMLLPGTHAKLEPPEGQSRSLLALSLILSLLLFKPAPMYILDEVDAALDLSHTQNIGVMLRSHFSHSQFIVVSLKEGMFNNANVIFRTRFIDGVSAVIRTNGKPRSASEQAAVDENAAKQNTAVTLKIATKKGTKKTTNSSTKSAAIEA